MIIHKHKFQKKISDKNINLKNTKLKNTLGSFNGKGFIKDAFK